jgi:HPt (histidine-containing phosphotransfer) domain-containing protein
MSFQSHQAHAGGNAGGHDAAEAAMGEDAMLEIPAFSTSAENSSGEASLTRRHDGPPIDLVHLSRQCQGDPDLEAELLGLFRQQARALSAQLSDPVSKSPEQEANIAHKLCGSALAVGAGRVADAAAAIEASARAARAGPPPERPAALSQAIAALVDAVAEAVAEIERVRG